MHLIKFSEEQGQETY